MFSINDTFGQTLMEAQACGLPVVVTNRGGLEDNVHDGETGIVVEGKSSEALAKGIESILNRALLQSMGKKASSHVRCCSFKKCFEELCSHYTLDQ